GDLRLPGLAPELRTQRAVGVGDRSGRLGAVELAARPVGDRSQRLGIGREPTAAEAEAAAAAPLAGKAAREALQRRVPGRPERDGEDRNAGRTGLVRALERPEDPPRLVPVREEQN